MLVSPSKLMSWSYCPMKMKLEQDDRRMGVPRKSNSRTSFGTLMHMTLEHLSGWLYEGMDEDKALEKAKEFFLEYWCPENIIKATDPIGEWLAQDTWDSMRLRGLELIEDAHFRFVKSPGILWGLEVPFNVPAQTEQFGRQEEDRIRGVIDRLTFRVSDGKPILFVEDLKTGKVKKGLRYNVQFTMYMWATLFDEFWDPWPKSNFERLKESVHASGYKLLPSEDHNLPLLERRGIWWDLSGRKVKLIDAGRRVEADYKRMSLAVAKFADAVEKEVYPLDLTGEPCLYCEYGRTNRCGGIPLSYNEVAN